jgi:hypothetical protein
LTGESLAPKLSNVAVAQARGQIGPEHVRTIEKFFDGLPGHIDYQTREAAEADLARIATELGPTQFRVAADRLALLLNQDGEQPTDAERARRRHLTIDNQGIEGMSRIHGLIDPECRATVEAVLAKWAAPGMCNDASAARCQAHHYLVIYDEHTREPLYCGARQALRHSRATRRAACARPWLH